MKSVVAWGFGLALVGAAGWLGWRYVQSERMAHTFLAQVAAMDSASAASAVEASAEPTDSERAQWKAQMTTACTFGGTAVTVVHFDINEDKQPDTVCLRGFAVAPYGDFVDVEARVHSGGKDQLAYILLPVDGGKQQAVCMADKGYAIEESHWTADELKDLFGGVVDVHPVSITVAGGNCDPPWLFWPKKAEGDEVQFLFARM